MKKAIPLILLVVLAVIALAIKQCNSKPENVEPAKPKVTVKKDPVAPKPNTNSDTRGLNRNPSNISYSKHARCRMGCRHIDESEVQEILKQGKINYAKSELDGTDCKKKYAVEGYTHDNQKVRIIFAPCSDEVTVVTVIDIGKEWPCDCE